VIPIARCKRGEWDRLWRGQFKDYTLSRLERASPHFSFLPCSTLQVATENVWDLSMEIRDKDWMVAEDLY